MLNQQNNNEKKAQKKERKTFYGDGRTYFELAWHDESKRDELVVVNETDFQQILNERAKGTTVYDLINLYGGIDEVTSAFADREKTALYEDVSDMPQMASNDEYMQLINTLQNQINELKQMQNEKETTTENVETPADKEVKENG